MNWKRVGAFVLMSWLIVPVGLLIGLTFGMAGLCSYAVTGKWNDPNDHVW